MSQRIVHLVRHGQIDPATPPPWGLTPLGRDQAVRTAARLSQLPITCLHHSTSARATETAAIIAATLPGVALRPSPLLLECVPYVPPAFSDWLVHTETEPPADDRTEIPAAMQPWLRCWARRPTLDEITRGQAQAQQAVATYFHVAGAEVQHEIVVSHCALLSYFICCALRAPLEDWLDLEIYNCGISEVLVDATV